MRIAPVRIALVLTVALLSTPVHARLIHAETSLYQNILVTEEDSVRCMKFHLTDRDWRRRSGSRF